MPTIFVNLKIKMLFLKRFLYRCLIGLHIGIPRIIQFHIENKVLDGTVTRLK